MVTILNPPQTIPTQPAETPETPPAALIPQPPVWGYTIPSPGVRYYTARPAAKTPTPAFLTVKLLDEKVFPL